MQPSIHDFSRSLEIARADAILREQLLKHFKTSALCSPTKSPLIDKTCNLVNWALRIGRRDYAVDEERLVAIISASEVKNALAVWGSTRKDWIVLSEGLIYLLQERANEIGSRVVSEHPWLFDTALGKHIQQLDPLPGLDTPISSFLYFAAITFFVGHESGHHVLGHDGYYRVGAHAEISSEPDPENDNALTMEQALEFQADRYGVMVTRIVMTEWLGRHWESREYTDEEKAAYQFVITFMLSAGTLMALMLIKPREIDWKEVPGMTHPPAVLRMVGFSDALTAAIKANFHLLTDEARRSIRLYALELAAEGTILPKTKEAQILQERRDREGNSAALRAVGLRKALYDPQTSLYMEQILNAQQALLPQLMPRTATG